jgi:Prealbumin-like fold domain
MGRWNFHLSRRTSAIVISAAALAIGIAIPSVSFADNASGCDFAATGTTQSCSPPLAGSTFAGGDGNLQTSPTTFGTTDWQNVGPTAGFDLASGQKDNSFGQGTKEDSPNVSVVTGSIPNNKSDLTRFYEASETGTNGDNFLYLSWERNNVLGSANMDFEINQATQPDLTTTGAKTLNRTAGDLLVTFDFTNGGGKPTLGLLFWLTAAAGNTASQCFASNSLPCWGNQETLNGTNSIGAVNNLDPVNDPLFPGSPNYINPVPALQFGETAIDLTKANVFPAGTCKAFGSAFVKSRSSASFPAEVKDFIAPVPVNISNCGTVTIIKQTDPRGQNQDFSFTSTIPDPAAGSTTPSCTTDAAPSSFTLNDNGNAGKTLGSILPAQNSTGNTETCTNVPQGSYSVTEGTEPANYTLESLNCIGTKGSSGTQDGTNPLKANLTVTADGTLTCLYIDQTQGAILVTKTAKNHNLGTGDHPLAGATFEVNGVSKQTDANGQACFDGLTIGTAYTVTETSAPDGYAIDTATKSVTPTSSADCSGNGTPTGVSFTDSPLTDLSVSATAEVAGVTNSKITCVDSSNANVGNSPQGFKDPVSVTANGLKPGTYTCTVVIDP